jgi:hypothetical protein
MNLPTAEASNAVVIAKNPAKGQIMVDDIPLAVILTGDPLNNYEWGLQIPIQVGDIAPTPHTGHGHDQ